MVWFGDAGTGSFSLYYPAITMHAVCRDTSGDFAHACIYLQLDPQKSVGLVEEADRALKRQRADATGEEPEDEDEEEEEEWQELRLVPEAAEGEDDPLGAIYAVSLLFWRQSPFWRHGVTFCGNFCGLISLAGELSTRRV